MDYSHEPVKQLLYVRNPKMIDSIAERRPDRSKPRSKFDGYAPGDLLEFEINTDQFVDLCTMCLNFKLAAGSANDIISNACDVIRSHKLYYNDILIDDCGDTNVWANAFILYSANIGWAKGEAHALMGYLPPSVLSDTDATTRTPAYTKLPAIAGTDGTWFSVPLPLLSGFFRMKNFLPVVGNRLRIALVLAAAKEVIAKPDDKALLNYSMNGVSLTYDTVILKPEYRSAVLESMQSEGGFRMPFTSYATNSFTPAASTEQNIQLTFNLSNALSLHILHDPVAAKDGAAAKMFSHYRQSFPLSNFEALRVKSGTKYFTPPDDVQSFVELYQNAQKTVSAFCDISGSGMINRVVQQAPLAVNNGNIVPEASGFCLLSANLEKTIESDDAVINNGTSSMEAGASNMFEIKIKTSSALAQTSKLLTNIVHKRALVFRAGGTAVEY
jgi:hypothetical protein